MACRLLLDLARIRRSTFAMPAAAVAGIVIASQLLIQGTSAATWFYIAGPAVFATGLAISRDSWVTAKRWLIATGVAATIVAVYLLTTTPLFNPQAIEIIRGYHHVGPGAVESSGLQFVLDTLHAAIRSVDGQLGVLAIVMMVILAWRKHFLAVGTIALVVVALLLVMINTKLWILPASPLLYPDRAMLWMTPTAALIVAWGWRYRLAFTRRAWIAPCMGLALLAMALPRHNHYYQRKVARPIITAAEWQALLLAERNLRPETDWVTAPYNSAGSYLPAVAGIPTTGWHLHVLTLSASPLPPPGREVTYEWAATGNGPTAVLVRVQDATSAIRR